VFGHHFKRGRAEHARAYRNMTYSWWEVWGGVLVPSQSSNTQRKKEDAFYSLQIFFFLFFLKAADQPNNSINNNKTEMCHTVENVITT
jgi:hypothetical protein